MISEETIEWSQGNTWCRIVGDPTVGTPLIVVHGGPGMSWEYLDAHDGLSNDGRAVIYYDQLGGFRSPAVGSVNWSMNTFVNELDAVVGGLRLGSYDLLGHSWGGQLAMEHAAGRSSGVRRLILSSAAPSTALLISEWRRLVDRLPDVGLARIEEMERAGRTASPEYRKACEQFEKAYFCKQQPPPQQLVRSMSKLAVDVYSALWGPEQFRCTGNLKDWDATDRLSRITAPTLVLHGEFDQATALCAEAIANALPGSVVSMIKGASHMAHYEKPSEYFSLVEKFLA